MSINIVNSQAGVLIAIAALTMPALHRDPGRGALSGGSAGQGRVGHSSTLLMLAPLPSLALMTLLTPAITL
jgi:hypothetical protein